MGRHEMVQKQLQVLYLGSSAALGALRRSMEAHGAVTRTRLTPALDAVVTDPSVPADHPIVRAAGSLGIPVLKPEEAITQLAAGWLPSPDPPPAAPVPPVPAWSVWSFRRG